MVLSIRTNGAAVPTALSSWTADPVDRGGAITPAAEFILSPDHLTITITRTITTSEVVVARSKAWSGQIGDEAVTSACHQWLTRSPDQLAILAALAPLVTSARIARLLTIGGENEIALMEADARKAMRKLEKAAEAERRALAIECYFRGTKLFKLELSREVDDAPLWTIVFQESWERDRFWDWLRWQRHRFEAFREDLTSTPAIELERRLLKEMLAAERKARRDGMATGGRRPLRLWRGEA